MARAKKQHLKQRADGRYCCVYKGIQFMGRTEEEALKAREDYKKQEQQGSFNLRKTTLYEYGIKWLPIAHPTVADSTYRGLAIHLEKLLKRLGDFPIDEIKPLQLKEVYSEDYKGLSNSYILSGKQLFCALFDSAIADGLCRTNPARATSAKPHKGTYVGHRAITDQERVWITTLCTDHRAYPAVMAMLYAGIRPQEMKAFQIERSVDFENETIQLKDFAHMDSPYSYKITGKGKTDNAVRTIPLFPPLKKALEGKTGYLATNARGERVNIQAWKSLWKSYVFHMEKAINGCEKRWYGKTREHKDILAAGGTLPPWIPFTVVPYDLRHSFCVMLRDLDPPVEMHTCIAWMGHADAQMILKIYDSLSDQRSKAEAEKVKNALRNFYEKNR